MDPPEHRTMEGDVLRLLCSPRIQPATRVAICRLLRSENFIEPMQRILFEEIAALGPVDARQLLELLPARVTNRGFPDFDLENLLDPRWAGEAEMARLFESVLRLIQLHQREP